MGLRAVSRCFNDLHVGASLLAKAVGQLASLLDVPTPSRASPLPQWGRVRSQNPCPTHKSCGSGLARESGGSACIAIDCSGAFASKPAPTVGACSFTRSMSNTQTLWERACSRKRWVSLHHYWMFRRLREQARSHSGGVFVHKIHVQHTNPVGAGLLAKAVGQLASLLDVPTPSRASPLPQWRCVRSQDPCPTHKPCGSGLARESGGSACIAIGCSDAFASKPAPTVEVCRSQDPCSTHNPAVLRVCRWRSPKSFRYAR